MVALVSVHVQAVCKVLNLEGYPYPHRTLGGIMARIQEPAGEGWTWRVTGSRAALEKVGAYEVEGESLVLDVGNGRFLPCEAIPG